MAQADRLHSILSRPPIPVLVRSRPSLADDCALYGPDPLGWDDPDRELFTWPEMMDQTRIGEPGRGRFSHDDDELDDGI